MIEAEFHAVWQDNNRNLYDITPKRSSDRQILFLPDPVRRYDRRKVNNVRRAIRFNRNVRKYLEAANAHFRLIYGGARAFQHGAISIAGAEVEEL